jgi:hypothetical protein
MVAMVCTLKKNAWSGSFGSRLATPPVATKPSAKSTLSTRYVSEMSPSVFGHDSARTECVTSRRSSGRSSITTKS